MPQPRKAPLLALLGMVLMLAAPAVASAEYYVPPGNSGANQYTEALPGAGGDRGGKTKGATPAEALGENNAKRLEERGEAGKAAAQLAAETAPAPQVAAEEQRNSSQSSGNGGGAGARSDGGTAAGGGNRSAATEPPSLAVPAGSSGIGEMLGQATGVSGGNLGLWLPLAIVAILAGSIVYRARLRPGSPA